MHAGDRVRIILSAGWVYAELKPRTTSSKVVWAHAHNHYPRLGVKVGLDMIHWYPGGAYLQGKKVEEEMLNNHTTQSLRYSARKSDLQAFCSKSRASN